MKKSTFQNQKWFAIWLKSFCLIILTSWSLISNAQIPYSRTVTSGGTYTPLSGAGITTINTVAQLSPGMSGTQDDGLALVTLPFTFSYAGGSYSTVTFCTNGWIGMGNQSGVSAADGRTPANFFTTTAPNNVIAAWFRDMGGNFPAPNPGSMRHGLTGTDVYTFQWDQAVGTSFSVTTTVLTSFQVSIYGPASSSPGRIEMLYGPTLGSIAFSAAIGIEDGIGGANHYINALDGTQTSTTTSTVWPGNGNGYRFDPLPACSAPIDQASALTLTSVSISQINGTFTPAPSAPTGYLVVRYPTGSTVTNPVNTINYSAGQSLGLGTVVASGSSTTFNNTGLLGSSTYDYYVYAYNNTPSTCSGPSYNMIINAGQNSGTQSTLACGSISSPLLVGPTGTYPTLSGAGGAIAAITASGISAPLVIELQSSYTAAGETYPIVINNNSCVTALKPITIRPELGSGPLTITSANTTATFDLSGANYVTIDGRPGGVGTSQNLIIENTSTTSASSGNAILLRNDASNNTLTYLNVKSANGNAASSSALSTAGAVPGAIAIAGTTGTTGNDNNTISNCDIHSTGANLGACIYAGNASTAGSSANNDNNVITNNNLYDFFLGGTISCGINVAAGNNSFNINNNRIYQTSPKTYVTSVAHRGMWITPNTASLISASGFNISNNTVGYSSSTGTGIYTTSGPHTFIAFDLSLGIGTASSVQGNVVSGLSMSTNSSSTTACIGIQIANGNVNVGTTTGNLIGSNTINGAISFTTSTSLGTFVGIRSSGGTGNTINISNNQVSGVTVNGSAATIGASFIGIAGAGGTNINITNNTVGSSTLANSILAPTVVTSAVAHLMRGIAVTSGTTTTVTGNLVANLTTNTNTTSATSTMTGIQVSSSSSTVSNNIIRDLRSATLSTGGGSTSAIVGIAYTATTAPATISGNTIHTLKLTNPSTALATQCEGIFYGGPTSGTNVIQKNLIHSLSMASPGNSAGFLTAIDVSSGLVTIKNNMIRMGIDDLGGSVVSPCGVRGISENAATTFVFHNSVYIGGTGVGVSTVNSFAYQRSGTTGADSIVNNIFVNNRSNATTGGKHYQVFFTTSTVNVTSINYNNYYGIGTGAVFASNGVADVASFSAGWLTSDISSLVGDPKFLDAIGSAANVNLHISATSPSPVELGGVLISSVAEDFDAQSRASLSPTDIGADAGNFTPLDACQEQPNESNIVGAAFVCQGSGTTLSLDAVYTATGISYQWASSTTPGGPYTTLLGTGPTQATGNLSVPTYYVCTISCFFSGQSFTTAEKSIAINSLPSVSASKIGVICNPGGSAVTLNASGASTYVWSPTTGLTPTSGSPVSALPTSNTIYTVTGTDGNGCTGTSTVAVNINSAVTVNSVVATPSTICVNGNTSLLASASFPASTYCAAGATTLGCSGTDEAITNVTFGSINNTSVCVTVAPQYQNFTSLSTAVTAGSTYPISITNIHSFSGDQITVWIDYNQNGLFTDPGEATIVPYVHVASGVNVSNGSITIPVSANNGPTRMRIRLNFTGTMDPCGTTTFGEVEDYTVNISGGIDPFTYTWSEPVGPTTLASLVGNPVSATNIPATTTYTVVATSTAGCTATGSGTVTINPLSCQSPTVPTLICSGQNFTISANTTGGGLPFSYSWNDGNGGTYPNAQSITANLATGSYTFTVTVSDNCGSVCTSTATINVIASPTGTASGPATAVTYQPLIYSVSGYNIGDNFQWQFATNPGGPWTNLGINDDSLTTTASSAGTFYIQCIITNAAGCSIATNSVITIVTVAGNQPCNAINLSLGLSGPYTNVGATVDAGEPVPAAAGCNVQNGWCNSTLENTVWFSFVAPPSGKVVINTGSPLWDNQMALYSVGNCGDYLTYTQLAANDDGGDGSFAAKITSICLVPGQTYYLQVDGYNGTTNSAFNLNLIQETAGVKLSAKAMLSGAYDANTGMMHDSLRVLGLVPLTEPYTSAPYSKPAVAEPSGETTTSTVLAVNGNNAIVDWVFIELRSASNSATIVATKRALIQRDGDIVDVDGVSALSFPSLSYGSYFVSVKHRNHLGVMTATAVPLGPCDFGVIDFTSGAVWVKAGEVNGPRRMFGSVATLWSSDANRNKNAKYNGIANDKQEVLNLVGVLTQNNVVSPTYRSEDLNMDGKVKYNNTDNDRNVIAGTVGVSTPNNIVNQHTPN